MMVEEIRETGTPEKPVVISGKTFPEGVHLAGCSYVEFSGNDVSNPNGHGIYITPGANPSHHIAVKGNKVHDCAGAGIDMDGFLGDGLVHYNVTGNAVTRCMGHGITVSGNKPGEPMRGVGIEGNEVSYIKRLGPAWGYGICMCFALDCYVMLNKSHHNAHSGIHLDGDAATGFGCWYNLIDSNQCWDNAGPGCEVEVSQGNDVIGNRIWRDEPLPEGADPWRNNGILVGDQSTGNQIDKNIIFGILEGPGICIDNRSPGTKILRNTILGGTTSIHVEDDESAEGVEIIGNILNHVICLPTWAAEGLVKADYNYHMGVALEVLSDPYAKWALFTWQQLTGRCVHSIYGDPLFVDAAANDFRLSSGSPCIGAGENGSDIGAIPFEEESDVVIIRDTVMVPELVEREIKMSTVVGDVNATALVQDVTEPTAPVELCQIVVDPATKKSKVVLPRPTP